MTHQPDHRFNGFCFCCCEECLTPKQECICPDGCACHRPTKPLPPAYYGEPTPAEAEHVCKDCGKDVVRKGTRGRWPSRCPECKEKA